jgi:hypothetical protein
MIKKTMLLAMAAAAIAAFAIPASASAYTNWTANGVTLGAEETAVETYEGFLTFTTPTPAVPVHSTFGCQVTAKIHVEGNTGKVTQFSPTTSTCEGTGVFAGCKLKSDTSTVPWTTHFTPTDIDVTAVKFTNAYEGCAVAGSELEFPSITMIPTLSPKRILSWHVSGTASNKVTVASGTVTAEKATPVLGLE